jgi:S1-C subfamily serine protease
VGGTTDTMTRNLTRGALPALALCLLTAGTARADDSLAKVAADVNEKMVKLFGSGGFGLAHYGTGVIVSRDGYILTVATPMLDTRELRIFLADGRRYLGKVVVTEPALDVALVKIETKDELDLPFFDVAEAARRPLVEPGTAALAHSNAYKIAERDEPMSVQRGVIATYTKLHGRKGIYEASFEGNVYILDAITNNPGSAGGAITTRKGELVAMIGKVLKNELSNTWINYAIPIQAAAELEEEKGGKRKISIAEIVEKKEKYQAATVAPKGEQADNYHGIVLVPNPVELTPPYVEEVDPNSPAAKAGLRPDDLIVYVNGEQVASINELTQLLGRVRPGNAVALEVRRGDKLQTVNLTMAEPKVKKRPRKERPDTEP